ncbi:MAG: helix-turn-helix transcriptional regulator, partial [Chloroflexia bacterium]|nr:helix-turn-helix transcriptional regulator [Chloroflexia bacterium]
LVCLAAHRFMGESETAAKRFGAAEAHLMAALDLAAACEAPFERALTLLALAELRLITGMANEAAALLEEVLRICTPLGAAPTLARADALAARLPTTRPDRTSFAGLTERELDVLRLLPEDLTLEQIAARLFVSYSTVKTHLDHIRTKLGVNQRREVVARAAQLGLLDPPRHPPSPQRVGDG